MVAHILQDTVETLMFQHNADTHRMCVSAVKWTDILQHTVDIHILQQTVDTHMLHV